MNTIGYLMVLTAGLIIRSVWQGRVMHLPEDLGDTFIAAISGDFAELKNVLSRKGDDLTPNTTMVTDGPPPVASGGTGAGLLSEMRRLAVIADNRYLLGSTGPRTYDCSGLVWRAAKNLDIYTGARFTTTTFPFASRKFTRETTKEQVGDIVLWPRHHMGVVSGTDKFFSARNRKSGIGEATISTFNQSVTPRYFRVIMDEVPADTQADQGKARSAG